MDSRYVDIPIVDVARRCGIEIDSQTLGRDEVEAKCPFCGDKPGRHHLGLNTKRNVYQCNYCKERGNSVTLYARLNNVSNRDAVKELLHGESKIYPLPHTPRDHMPPEREPLPLSERHKVFRAMLSHLQLSDRHRQDLLNRGLSDQRIERNAYRTLPKNERARLSLAGILSAFYNLDGVPGFCRNSQGRWTIAGQQGLLIPYRSAAGLIQGIQIRLDETDNPKRKYRWLASTGRQSGVKSSAWIHITGNTAANTAYLTEGGLKGDVASFLDDESLFICVAGVNAIDGLREAIRSLNINQVVIAADMDKVTNWRVRNGFDNIAKVVSRIPGVSVRAENWNPSHKGIDDYYKVRSNIRKEGKIIAMRHNNITAYLHALWKKEYPMQDAGFINACEWEEKLVPLSSLEIDPPKDYLNLAKAKGYQEQMAAGAVFPPLVCINGMVIDGYHRCWAYEQLGQDYVRIYQNIPWEVEAATAA